MHPDQTALDLHCLLKTLQKHFWELQKQITLVVIGALSFNKCGFSVYTVTIFMKCTQEQTTYLLTFFQIINIT